MPHFDASNADVFIYTQRESGSLLSHMGHDLKIEVTDFGIDVDLEASTLSAHFNPASLEPVDAIKWESREETGELSAGDRHDISQHMSREVLDVEHFPDIEFEATAVEPTNTGWHVTGRLDLHGETRQIDFDVERDDGRARMEVVIDQTDFDIEPYSAILGSLKVRPEVIVTVEAPIED